MSRTTQAALRVLTDAVARRVFPAAVAEAGSSREPIWQTALGTRTFDESTVVDASTPFDLASLTKVIATTTLIMHLVGAEALSLEQPVAALLPEWRGLDREHVTVLDLLEHASGLPARLVDPPPGGRREFEHDICTIALEYVPRKRSVYSDLGFILLGFIAAGRGKARLDEQWVHFCQDPSLVFELGYEARRRAAPTLPESDDVRRGRILVGEVHDSYAAALGGVAGHAGLFGTATAVGAFARAALRSAKSEDEAGGLMRRFTTKSTVPGSSRALGWDTMLPSSSCGTRMSTEAFGHVGYTGTSLWIDPARDRYFVLLTNRACGGGSLEAMREVRRAFHDALEL